MGGPQGNLFPLRHMLTLTSLHRLRVACIHSYALVGPSCLRGECRR